MLKTRLTSTPDIFEANRRALSWVVRNRLGSQEDSPVVMGTSVMRDGRSAILRLEISQPPRPAMGGNFGMKRLHNAVAEFESLNPGMAVQIVCKDQTAA
jgi:hypothetical protein